MERFMSSKSTKSTKWLIRIDGMPVLERSSFNDARRSAAVILWHMSPSLEGDVEDQVNGTQGHDLGQTEANSAQIAVG
jgi:hypothetical protein